MAKEVKTTRSIGSVITKTQHQVAKTVIFPTSLSGKLTVSYSDTGLVVKNTDGKVKAAHN